MRYLSAIICFICFSLVSAQTCMSELRGDLTDAQLAESASGLDAARLLKRAVDLLEPVLPQLANTPDFFPLKYDDEGYDEAKFLAQREVLSPKWQAESLSEEAWQEMVQNVADWYRLPASVSSDLSLGGLLLDLSDLIAQARPNLRPVALVATDGARGVAFWAVIRKTSPFPRLVVMRPPGAELSLSGGVNSALPLMETCAVELDKYIHASADTAQTLFDQNFNRVDMYVASTAPVRMDGFSLVPPGEETRYFTFQSDALREFDTYAAAFYGSGIGVPAALRLVSQIRTNMNPQEIARLVFPN